MVIYELYEPLLIIAWKKHEWTSSEGILFQPQKDVNTHRFSSSSPLMLIYSGLFVGQFCIMIGQIRSPVSLALPFVPFKLQFYFLSVVANLS